jgi:glutathionyl-hydroquinone reductase
VKNLLLLNQFCSLNEYHYGYFRDINNGVYRSGFATSQEAYDTAVEKLFQGLDKVGQ